jgi:Skp family chaperone for outer membrane proteins
MALAQRGRIEGTGTPYAAGIEQRRHGVKRANMYLTALVGLGGMLILISASQAQQPGAAPGLPPQGLPPQGAPPPVNQPATQSSRPTIAVFNMAAVMKEYGKAKYQVYLLNEEKKKMSTDLVALRGQYVKTQQDIALQANPTIKEEMQKRQVELARQLEDKTREIDKHLNEKASLIISSLYDEIKSVVDRMAEMNGYHIVFAYPDGVGAEEMKNA